MWYVLFWCFTSKMVLQREKKKADVKRNPRHLFEGKKRTLISRNRAEKATLADVLEPFLLTVYSTMISPSLSPLLQPLRASFYAVARTKLAWSVDPRTMNQHIISEFCLSSMRRKEVHAAFNHANPFPFVPVATWVTRAASFTVHYGFFFLLLENIHGCVNPLLFQWYVHVCVFHCSPIVSL